MIVTNPYLVKHSLLHIAHFVSTPNFMSSSNSNYRKLCYETIKNKNSCSAQFKNYIYSSYCQTHINQTKKPLSFFLAGPKIKMYVPEMKLK